MNILKGRRNFSGDEDSQGHPLILHANLGSNSLVRRKLRMGAKTVGSLSMKICGEGVQRMDGAKRGAKWGICPISYPLPHFRCCPTHSSGLIFQC